METKLKKTLAQKRADVQAVLQQLNLAFRSIQLYPDDHVISTTNIVELHARLRNHTQKYGQFVLCVTKDNIVVDDIAIDKEVPGAGALALHLFRLKLERIVIDETIDEKQLKTFLQLICLDPREVLASEGLSKLLRDRKVTAVHVFELLLRTTGEAEITKTKDEAPANPESQANFSRFKQVLLAEVEPSTADAYEIRNLITNTDPEALAGFLGSLHPNGRATKKSARVIKDALSEMDKLFIRSLPEDQVMLYKKLAESILTLGKPLLKALAPHLINTNMSELRAFAPKLIAHLPDVELVRLIKLYVSAKDFPPERILDEIKDMPFSFERFRSLTPLLAEEFSVEKDLLRDFFKSILEKEEALSKALNQQIQDENESAGQVTNSKEFEELKNEIAGTVTESQVAKLVLGRLREAVSKESEVSYLEKMTDMIVEVLIAGIRIGDGGLVVDAVTILAEERDRRSSNEEEKKVFDEAMKKAGAKEKVEKIFSLLDREQKKQQENVERYFELLGGYTIPTLIEILVDEERRGRRHLICKLLTSCAGSAEGLVGQLNDPRWFVVRNLVFVLGEIGDEKSIVYLEGIASHEDARVRVEIIKALSKLGPSTVRVLEDMLEDRDYHIKVEAIRALGKIKNQDAIASLLSLVESRDLFLRQVDVKSEAILALGKLQAYSAKPVLARMANRRSWLFHGRNKKLKEAATQALAQVAGG